MGKNPAFLFYPADWQRDLEEHPLEIEGAWIRICCKLSWEEPRGSATKTLTQWSRIMRVGEKKSLAIIEYLLNQNIADVIIQNSSITITSRRMVRDEYIKNIRRSAGSKGGNPLLMSKEEKPVLDKQSLDKQKPTPSVSVSVSSSVTKKTKNIKTPIPLDFKISERVKKWAEKKHITNLDAHFESFIFSCNSKGYEYIDWDSAFMNAVVKDWAKLGEAKDGRGHDSKRGFGIQAEYKEQRPELSEEQRRANVERARELAGKIGGVPGKV
jgi:hypothetical protein